MSAALGACRHLVCVAADHAPAPNGGCPRHVVVLRCLDCKWVFPVPCEALGADLCRTTRGLDGAAESLLRTRAFPGPPDGDVDEWMHEPVSGEEAA